MSTDLGCWPATFARASIAAGAACGLIEAGGAAAAPAPVATGEAPWTVSRAANTAIAAPRILLTYDMEGLSGQDDPFTWQDTHPQYARGQRLLTDDVNAVIDGLFAGGAGSVSVLDCHGGGNYDIDILVDEVDRRARRITEAPVHCGSTYAKPGAFDAVVAVAMHAGSGSGGFSAHTATLGVEIRVNGRRVNETEMSALAYGQAGIPVIFASGDDVLRAELRSMPWIEYVEVKKAKGPMSAEAYPLSRMHVELAAGAKRAVGKLRQAVVPTLRGSVTMIVKAFPPADLSWLKNVPGVVLDDGALSVTANDYQAAARAAAPILEAAMYGPTKIVLQAAQRHPDWKKIEREAVDELMRIWSAREEERRVQR